MQHDRDDRGLQRRRTINGEIDRPRCLCLNPVAQAPEGAVGGQHDADAASLEARAMRPDLCASNNGRRPPWIRLWTNAEMNTVLPARERPVTPSLNDGEKSPVARPDSVSRAILASSVKVVSDDAKICSLGLRFLRYRLWNPALKWRWRAT